MAQTQWNKTYHDPSLDLNDVTYAKDRFVVVGNKGVAMVSFDSQKWALLTDEERKADFKGVAYWEDAFWAVGAQKYKGVVYRSEDGIDWKLFTHTPEPLEGIGTTEEKLFVFGKGGRYHSLKKGAEELESPDPLPCDSLDAFLSIPAKKCLLLAGNRGALFSSENGTDWEKLEPGLKADVKCMAYGEGLCVVTGKTLGEIATSTDLKNWERHKTEASRHFNGILFSKSNFVIVGAHSAILTSPYGFQWYPQYTGNRESPSLKAVAFNGKDAFITVGEKGSIMRATLETGR